MAYMLINQEKKFFVARCYNLSGQLGARALISITAKVIAKFIYKKIICYYSYLCAIIFDKESENKDIIKILCKKYNIKQIQILLYNIKANRIIKQNYKSIKSVLSKIIMKEIIKEAKE